MDTERSGLDEAMDVGSSTVSHLKSLKNSSHFSPKQDMVPPLADLSQQQLEPS